MAVPFMVIVGRESLTARRRADESLLPPGRSLAERSHASVIFR